MSATTKRAILAALGLGALVGLGFLATRGGTREELDGDSAGLTSPAVAETSDSSAAETLDDASNAATRQRADASAPVSAEAASERDAPAAPAERIEIHVVDATTSAPVRRFRVNQTWIEDANGWFELEKRSLASLVVTARGRIEWARAGVELDRFLRSSPLVVRLARNPDVGRLTLRVGDARGRPLAGASVRAIGGLDAIDERTPESGELVLEDLNAGRFELRVELAGWTDAAIAVEVERESTREHRVVLERSAPCRVRITDEFGEPARRAALAVLSEGQRELPFHWVAPRGAESRWSRTDGNDAFEPEGAEAELAGLRPGWYVLRVLHRDESAVDLAFEVRAEEPTRIDARVGGGR